MQVNKHIYLALIWICFPKQVLVDPGYGQNVISFRQEIDQKLRSPLHIRSVSPATLSAQPLVSLLLLLSVLLKILISPCIRFVIWGSTNWTIYLQKWIFFGGGGI